MRKWITTTLCAVAAVTVLTGCSPKKTAAAESSVQSDSNAESAETTEPAQTEEYVAESSITLGKYKGIPVTVKKAEVTDEELEQQITQILNSKPQYTEVNRAAKEGDTVNIDYTGLLDGKAFDGGTAQGYDLELGSHTFIDGFEDGLIGVKKGDKKDLNLTFPADYGNKDLAGKAVVFQVTVNSVKEKSIPELNDAFVAAEYPEQKTVEQFRKELKDNMLESKQNQIDNQRNSDIINAIMDDSQVVCSTDAVNKEYEDQLSQYTKQASMYGMDLASMAQMYGMDEDSFKAQLRQSAENTAKQDLVVDEIAKRENITVNDEDRENLAKINNAANAEELIKNYGQELVDRVALNQKVMNFLVENADITVIDSTDAPAAGNVPSAESAAGAESVPVTESADAAESAAKTQGTR